MISQLSYFNLCGGKFNEQDTLKNCVTEAPEIIAGTQHINFAATFDRENVYQIVLFYHEC